MKYYLSDIKKKQSMRYCRMDDESVDNADWQSITIEGCIISGCNILSTTLFNSDIIGTTLIMCNIVNADFTHSDLCSNIASNVKFENVDFGMSTMRDCDYSECIFLDCKFEHIAMTHTKFINCTFKNIHIKQSSSYINEFYNCTFENCRFEGNFFYSIFSNCTICDDFISDKLRAFNLILNSNVLKANNTNNDLIAYLESNFLFLNIEIYKLNTFEINLDTFILESLIAIAQIIKHDVVIRLEQIEFIQKTFEYTCNFCHLTLLTINQGMNILDTIFEETSNNNIALQKTQPYLNQLKNTMYLEYVQRMNALPKVQTFELPSKSIICKITYKEKPSIQLSEIINNIFSRLNVDVVSERIKTEKGSFVEFIKVLSVAEPLIQIILTLTTGVFVPIIIEKVKSKSTQNKDNPNSQSIQNINTVNSNINSPTIINNYNITLTEFDPQTQKAAIVVVQALNTYNLNAANNYLGYSKENVQSVVIIDPEDMR